MQKPKKDVAAIMNRLYQKGLTTTSGGNVSAKYKDRVYITPSQTDKGNMRPEQIGIVSLNNENLTPQFKLSMETGMHLGIYNARKDINAVVHAHPFTASTLSAEEGLLNTRINGEARAMLGQPGFVPYETMGTPELADAAAKAIINTNVLILQHHGIIAVGETLLQAFDRLELTEMTARSNVLRSLLNIDNQINDNGVAIIDQMFDQFHTG